MSTFLKAAACALILTGSSVVTGSKAEAVSNVSLAQTTELIVQVQGDNEKNHAQLEARLRDTPGVTIDGYCGQWKVFLLRIDRSIQADDSFLIQIFAELQLSYELKTGTIEQIRSACGMPPSISNSPD